MGFPNLVNTCPKLLLKCGYKKWQGNNIASPRGYSIPNSMHEPHSVQFTKIKEIGEKLNPCSLMRC